MSNFIQKLQQRLLQPLPAWQGHQHMASHRLVEPVEEKGVPFYNIPEVHKKAGVMVLVYLKDNQWHTSLMQRPPSQFVHGRQISFPGGGREPHDADMRETALRETQEEFGIPSHLITVLGALTPLFIPVSNYLVHPFVGYMAEHPHFVPDPNEVAAIMEVPLAQLTDPAYRKIKDITTPEGFHLKNVPYFDIQNRMVWGATAMMLSEFAVVLQEIE